jgi:hypothetical protein
MGVCPGSDCPTLRNIDPTISPPDSSDQFLPHIILLWYNLCCYMDPFKEFAVEG